MDHKNIRDPLSNGGRRREDHISLSSLAKFGLRYNWVITLLFAFFLALGFGFKTPKDAFEDVENKIDKNYKIDSATFVELRKVDYEQDIRLTDHLREMNYLRELVEGMAVRDCQLNFDKAQEALIPCSKLLRERGLR